MNMKTLDRVQNFLKNNQKTWLITGVAGFIGSNLLERLLILNQKVIGIDNFSTGYRENIDKAILDANTITGIDTNHNFKFIEGDIRCFEDCLSASKNVNYILHQAALGSVPRSVKDPLMTNDVNINGFLNILLCARDNKVDRVIYAASSSTYGDCLDSPKIENRIGNPLSPYAVTKAVNELYSRVFYKIYNVETIGLRYFNIFGKRQDPQGEYAAVIPKWINALINSDDIFINGDGTTSRDFCYVDNAIEMNIISALSENPKSVNEVYNVALGDSTSLNDLYEIIKLKLSRKVEMDFTSSPLYRDFRQGDVKHSLADISKAKNLLGYDPIYKIHKGLDKTIDWYIRETDRRL